MAVYNHGLISVCGYTDAGVYVDKHPYSDAVERSGEYEKVGQFDDQRRRKPGDQAVCLESLRRLSSGAFLTEAHQRLRGL